MNITPKDYESLDLRDAMYSLAVAGLTLALFLYFLTPPFPSDQLDYFYHAWQIDMLQSTHRHLRIGLIWPVWLIIQFFGYCELSYYIIPALGALFLALGTWFIGRMLFDRWIGVLSALLVIYNPWVLTSFTELLPDYLAAGLCTAAIGILVWCWRGDRLATNVTRPTTFLLLLLAGLLIGWSYLTREYVVIVFPAVILIILAMGGRVAVFAAVALGAAVCWFLELGWGFTKYGDPLARLHAVASPRAVSRFVEMDVIDNLLQLPGIFLARSGGLIYVFLLACGIGVSIWLSVRGDRRWQLLASWIVGGWLFFTIIALLPVILLGEERVYLRMHKFRYWAIILPPIMISGVAGSGQLAGYIAKWADPSGTRHAGAWIAGVGTAAILVCASFAVFSENYSRRIWNGGYDYAQFRKFISESKSSDEIVFFDYGLRSLPIYLNTWNGGDRVWRGEVTVTSTQSLDDIIRKPGKRLIAVDLTRAEKRRRKGESLDEMVERLEQAGEKLFESAGGRVVVYELDNRQAGGRGGGRETVG